MNRLAYSTYALLIAIIIFFVVDRCIMNKYYIANSDARLLNIQSKVDDLYCHIFYDGKKSVGIEFQSEGSVLQEVAIMDPKGETEIYIGNAHRPQSGERLINCESNRYIIMKLLTEQYNKNPSSELKKIIKYLSKW